MEYAIDFLAGAGYGFTSVFVGQPFDTLKTRMAVQQGTMMSTGKDLFKAEGIRGFYRGSLPILLGGTLFRSAQFGVYSNTLALIHQHVGKPDRVFGFFDVSVAVAGVCGGLGRAAIESPAELIKTRRQLNQSWRLVDVFKGGSATMGRNSLLFSSFVTYMDFSKQIVPGGLSPFMTGAICANLAWLTVWPLDVVKSRAQSGMYAGRSNLSLLIEVVRTGAMFRGIMPGLTRSFFANGCSMTVYQYIKDNLLRDTQETVVE